MTTPATAPALKTIREIHDAYDRKSLSAVELTQQYLSAARASDHNAILTFCEERALEQARSADAVIAREGKVPRDRLPLLGIPLGLKDNLCLDGVRMTCGSKILENYVAPYTATSVERLEAAGAISLAKLNMDEFGMGGSNENSAFGPVKHPSFADRVPGGSSGGSATSVGANFCVASLGSDTGGSIRLPASFCGIVGIKPSYGRISRYGLVAFASSLDQIGPMARNVEDAAVLLDVMSGHDPKDSTSAPLPATQSRRAIRTQVDWSKLRVGVPKEYQLDGLGADVQARVQESLRWMEKQGAKLVDISMPHTLYSVAVYYIIAVCEASSNLSRFDGVRFGVRPPAADSAQSLDAFYKKVRSNFGPEVKRRILLGTFALSEGYSEAYYRRACQVRALINRDFDQAFEKADFIAGPVSPTTAYRLGEKIQDPLTMYLNDIFTIPANLAGLPGLSVPCGQDSQGLPVGLQLLGPRFSEDLLLSVAHGFEKGRS